MTHDVFISFSNKDQVTADAICRTLEAQDIKCWIAHRDIPGGKLYPGAIIEAINASRVFVLVFSSNSNQSNDVMNEVERAFSKEIPIIPFRVENVQPSMDLQYFLSSPQWLNAFAPPLEFHLETLTDSVGALLKIPRKTKRKRHLSPIQLKVVVGVVLAMVVGALLYFYPFGRSSAVDYEKQFREAIVMLGSDSEQVCLEGVRSLDKISESGGEYWYWQAMNQLTAYVRNNAPWPERTDLPPHKKAIIKSILEVIGTRPAVYPANFAARDKEKKRRDLKKTDLRGLRLVSNAHLEYVDLEGANLENAVLTGANLEGAMLKDTILRNADLGGSCMEGVDLLGADVYDANLRVADTACEAGKSSANGDKNQGKPEGGRGIEVSNIMLALNWECAHLSDEVLNQIQTELGEKISREQCK